MTPEMTNKEKLPIIDQHLPGFNEMLNSFMNDMEDEENIVFLVAQSCSFNFEQLGSCFHLILQ